MATTLTANVNVVMSGTFNGGADLGTLAHDLAKRYNQAYANGTAADQANMIFMDTRSINASSNEDLDLAGSLTSAFGATITFTAVKAIIVHSASTNGDVITVGGSASNAVSTIFADTSDKINIRPGGTFLLTASDATGYAITANTADLLNVANTDSGAAASYDVVIIGEV